MLSTWKAEVTLYSLIPFMKQRLLSCDIQLHLKVNFLCYKKVMITHSVKQILTAVTEELTKDFSNILWGS